MVRRISGKRYYWRSMLALLWFAGTAAVSALYAQTPVACSEVTADDIVAAAATCEGNGTITVPVITGGNFVLTGGPLGGTTIPQDDPVFESLNPGTYTVLLYCEGTSTPVSFPVTVADQHAPLGLTLAGSVTCPGTGVITATGLNGYNLGNGAEYRFAIWPQSEGGAGRPDEEVSYSSIEEDGIYEFTGLDAGTYFVRVADKCQNFYTQTITITSSTPNIAMGHTASWLCMSGQVVRQVTNSIGVSGWQALGYKYKVEAIGSGDCATANVESVIVGEKLLLTEDDLRFYVPATVTRYRVTTISPCGGHEEVRCYDMPSNLGVETRVTVQCGPGEEEVFRLAYHIYGANNYSISYPVSLTLTGNGGFSHDLSLASGSGNIGNALADIPVSAFPLELTFEDACGVIRQQTIQKPAAGSVPSLPWASYNRTCVDPGNANVEFYLSGYIFDVENPDTQFELIDVATGLTVATVTGLEWEATNSVLFPNVPAGKTYRIRVTPPAAGTSGENCSAVETGTLTVPASQGLYITADPLIEKVCNNGTNRWNWRLSHNSGGHENVVLKVTQVDGDFERTSGNSGSFTIPPGVYNWSVTFNYPGGCTREISGEEVVVEAWQVDPIIDKSLAVTCQPLGEGPLLHGSAIIEFSGYGPFRIELRENSGAFTTVETNAEGPSYEVEDLETGKTYIFRITDQCGKTATQQVIVKPLSPRIITNTFQPCEDEAYTLSGVEYPGASYVWSQGGNVIGNEREYAFTPFTEAHAGTYQLEVSILGGCVVRQTTVTLAVGNCNQPFPMGSIGDYVWYDDNYDGLQSEDEDPAPGVPVYLEAYVGPTAATPEQLANPANWTQIAEDVTDSEGKYLFDELETGYYRVRFGAVAGYEFAGYQTGGADSNNRGNGNDSNAGAGGYSGPVYINANDDTTPNARHNMTIDAGLVAYGSIGDYVWYDSDLDGIQDAGEHGVKDIVVKLYKKNGETWEPAGERITDANGKYLFDKLQPGTYQVEFVIPESLADVYDFALQYVHGSSSTNPYDSDADRTTGRSGEIVIDVTLAPGNVGRDNMTIDAGLIDDGTLPVKLASFNAEKTGEGTALLTWSTTEEVNSSRFVVLQSSNGQSWLPVGEVEAKGNSVGLSAYTFVDKEPYRGVNYYRLKIVDQDGSFELSNIRSLAFEGIISELTLYPNPISDYLQIRTGARENVSKVELYDANGRLVLTDARMTPGKEIGVKGLAAGTYVLKITLDNGATELRKVVINR